MLYLLFKSPDLFGHTVNYILANFLVTPAHIVPEWYFLPLYAVLRSVTNKILGIVITALFLISLFFFPYLNKHAIQRSGTFKPAYKFVF